MHLKLRKLNCLLKLFKKNLNFKNQFYKSQPSQLPNFFKLAIMKENPGTPIKINKYFTSIF